MSTDGPPSEPPDKQLSSPTSTGGAGVRFEVQVMSAFAVLMLAGGVAPCLDCGPISKIKLQERKSGYRIDDFVVHTEKSAGVTARRLLVQVASGITFTANDSKFGETTVAAWRDYHDEAIFDPKQDAIAVVTGPLSAADNEGIRTVLEWARTRTTAQEFFTDVRRSKLSSELMRDKLDAIRSHVNTAAGGSSPSDDDVFEFLRRFHVLGYDLDVRSGTTHSFLRTIIGCFRADSPPGQIWARILEDVGYFNLTAGTLTVANFSPDIRDAFRLRVAESIPDSLAATIPPKEVGE